MTRDKGQQGTREKGKSMIAALIMAFTVFMGQAKTDGVVLPDTPQGKAVQAWVKAFNSGDEKAFLRVQDELMSPAVLTKRTPEDRAKMFQRMKGDFGTMKIEKVVKARKVRTRDLGGRASTTEMAEAISAAL